MPVSHYSFIFETMPLFPWEQEHLYIPQSFTDLFAIFRCEVSKFITEGGHWDSWISTSSTSHVILHLYLFTSPSLFPYYNQIQIPVSQFYVLQCVLSSTNINVCRRILVLHSDLGKRLNIRDEAPEQSSNRWVWRIFSPSMFDTSLYLHFKFYFIFFIFVCFYDEINK